ncbi:hypothetical protein BDV59DRAFT_26676 [Aspergillus ambiguus]|uniref:uncharacterized protein n=1 Tax=Aspergillus ambiguus TaxID=176160 RepID=UPI003CCDAE2B
MLVQGYLFPVYFYIYQINVNIVFSFAHVRSTWSPAMAYRRSRKEIMVSPAETSSIILFVNEAYPVLTIGMMLLKWTARISRQRQ